MFGINVRGGEDVDVVEETNREMRFQRNAIMGEVSGRFGVDGINDE